MLRKLWSVLTIERGEPYWTIFLRATAFVGLAGIPLVTYFPSTAPLVWLWLVGIPANSPISPLFPTAFEPLMMEVVKYVPVLTTAIVATAIFVYMEFINWYVYSWVMDWNKFETVRDHKWVKWGVKRFAKAPRFTVLRQGADRTCFASAQSTQQRAIYWPQHRSDPPRIVGIRAFWPRTRRFHWGDTALSRSL